MRTTILLILVALVLAPVAAGGDADARKTYEEKARAAAADDARARYLLGLWCRQNGLDEEARQEFERVVALATDHEGARRELGYVRLGDRWLSEGEAMREKGLVTHEGQWMLPEQVARLMLPATERERLRVDQAKVRKLLRSMNSGGPKVERMVVSALAGIDDASKVEPLAYALRYPAENVRVFAATELGRIGDRSALRPLVHRSLVDPSESVRLASLNAAMGFGDPNLLAPYAKALFSQHQPIRVNAADSLGELGEVVAVEYLIYRLESHGGGINRSHIYLANQLSFIQDFDVEVAQTAFIADPIVGILQEGQVLDVRVLSTERTATMVERRVITRALKKLSGEDLGDQPGPWAKWWKENKDELAKE